jgi:Protein of unknown function (DUF3099)
MNRGRWRRAPEPGPSSSAPVVHSITSAAQAHSDDMDRRIKRYLISMGIRTVCVILVLVVHGPSRWVFAVLAIILPYIAVVMANAVGSRRGSGPQPVPSTQLPIADKPEKSTGVQASSEQTNAESHEWTA